MNESILTAVVSLFAIAEGIVIISLSHRNTYMFYKLLHRMSPEEFTQMQKTACKFWSFLK